MGRLPEWSKWGVKDSPTWQQSDGMVRMMQKVVGVGQVVK